MANVVALKVQRHSPMNNPTAIGCVTDFVVFHVSVSPVPGSQGRSESMVLVSLDGRRIELSLSAECCSSSYFEVNSVADVKGLVGHVIMGIEHVGSGPAHSWDDGHDNKTEYHAIKITTDRCEIVVDWRNESNGYYDGECEIAGWPAEGLVMGLRDLKESQS